jgi:hypothetical protein
LVEGLIAYAKGEYARTMACLQPIHERIIEIGGSHAQRELFTDILLDAALQTGTYDVASVLLETKRRYRPERPLALFALEKLHAAKGDSGPAAALGATARRLWHDMGADRQVLEAFTTVSCPRNAGRVDDIASRHLRPYS